MLVVDITNPPPICGMEEEMLNSNQGDGSGWKNYPGHGIDPVKYSKRFAPGDRIAWGKAEAVVHKSPKEILAYLLLFTSYSRNDEHYAKQVTECELQGRAHLAIRRTTATRFARSCRFLSLTHARRRRGRTCRGWTTKYRASGPSTFATA